MVQIPIETAYLIGVLAAFAAFALTLFAVSVYVRLPDHARTAKAPELEGLMVRGEPVLFLD